MTIQENIEAVRIMRQTVETHPMCASFEDTGSHYFVLYPRGMCLDGCRVNYSESKLRALQRLHARMEKDWRDSCVS